MAVSRRAFLGSLVAAAVAPVLPNIPAHFGPIGGPVGGIFTATFKFWRKQDGPTDFDHLRASMRDIYNRCSAGCDAVPEHAIFYADGQLHDIDLGRLVREG